MALRDPRYSTGRLAVETTQIPAHKQTWQGYLLSDDERRLINALVGQALLDPVFCERLLTERDAGLFSEFGFRTEIVSWLCSIEVTSLSEFAAAVSTP